jgi:hypothetical protein
MPLALNGESHAANEREKAEHATNVANHSLSHATLGLSVDLNFRLEEFESVCGCAPPKMAEACNYHVGSAARSSLSESSEFQLQTDLSFAPRQPFGNGPKGRRLSLLRLYGGGVGVIEQVKEFK